jgi:hypothetical protein
MVFPALDCRFGTAPQLAQPGLVPAGRDGVRRTSRHELGDYRLMRG